MRCKNNTRQGIQLSRFVFVQQGLTSIKTESGGWLAYHIFQPATVPRPPSTIYQVISACIFSGTPLESPGMSH